MPVLPAWLPKSLDVAAATYEAQIEWSRAQDPEEGVKKARRILALGDLFYLAVYVLGREDFRHPWIFQRCREVQADPDGVLDLWAREHFKSSIISNALTIQDILKDPEITVGFFSHNRPIAKQFLRQIKTEFETNEDLKNLFPDVLWADPKREAPKWSEDDGLIVRRRKNLREATVEAWGLVDGMPTSKHFALMVLDDVVTEKSVTTAEMMAKTTKQWELADNLSRRGGRKRVVGTIYDPNDTYSAMRKRGSYRVRVHPCTVNGKEDGEPVLLTRAEIAKKRRDQGLYVFSCQMLLDPQSAKGKGFKPEWKQYWPRRQFANLNKIIIVDPANTKKKKSDYTAMWVLGLGADDIWRVCDMVRDRLSLTERADALFALHREWAPIEKVGYEEYGLQADIAHMKDRMERDNYVFTITPLGGTMGKIERISRLNPIFEQGRILFPTSLIRHNWERTAEDLVAVFWAEEYDNFPLCAHDDMFDALSRAICDEDMRITKPRPNLLAESERVMAQARRAAAAGRGTRSAISY